MRQLGFLFELTEERGTEKGKLAVRRGRKAADPAQICVKFVRGGRAAGGGSPAFLLTARQGRHREVTGSVGSDDMKFKEAHG